MCLIILWRKNEGATDRIISRNLIAELLRKFYLYVLTKTCEIEFKHMIGRCRILARRIFHYKACRIVLITSTINDPVGGNDFLVVKTQIFFTCNGILIFCGRISICCFSTKALECSACTWNPYSLIVPTPRLLFRVSAMEEKITPIFDASSPVNSIHSSPLLIFALLFTR